jgi:hypothetical protein
MCKEDIRIARASTTNSKNVTGTSAAIGKILDARPDRTAVRCGLTNNPLTANGWIEIGVKNGDTFVALWLLNLQSGGLLLTVQHDGPIIRQELYAVDRFNDWTVGVTECWLPVALADV